MVEKIQTLTIDRFFHGVVVVGKTTEKSNNVWWSKWPAATYYEIERDMAKLNVVFNLNTPLLSGVVSTCFISDNDTYEIVVPLQPLFFGVRLAFVYDNSNIYFKLDPECYTDLPHNFVAWISGILSQFHDQTIGHATCVPEWIEIIKTENVGEIKVWEIFKNAYNIAVQSNSHREAYDIAVTDSKKEVQRIKNALTVENFRSRLQNALNNAPEFLKVLESVGVEWNYDTSCVNDMKRLSDTLDDFCKDRSSFESEFTLAKTVLEYQSLYDCLLKKVTNNVYVLKQDENIQNDYAGALSYALELIKKEYQMSDLYVVFYALSFVQKNTKITYDVTNVKNVSLKSALTKYNQEKLRPSKAESVRIEKAKSFSTETSILSWRLEELDELLQNHRKMAIDKPIADNFLDRIEAHFQREKWGFFYRKEIGLESLIRNGIKLEDYIVEINKVISPLERTMNVEKILKAKILQEFGRLNYWQLKKETLTEVTDGLQILCDLVTRLGSAPIPPEPAWPNLPLVFNSFATTVFRSSEDVENVVIGYQTFRKPARREWFVDVSALERSNFNTIVDLFVGKELKQAWNNAVVKVYNDARKRVQEVKDKYESTIKEIVRLAEEDDLRAVYTETIKKCHTPNKNKYDTWWELVELEFSRRSPHIFRHVANVTDKQAFIQHVVENKWHVTMLPNEREHQQWIEELSFGVLRRAHNDTAKQLLTAAKRLVSNAIEERREVWWRGVESIDRTVDEYYDVEFVSANEEIDTLLVPCTQFQQLKPELNRVLVYATRIYGLDAIGTELVNWIADGYGKWMVTDHVKEQFVSAHNIANSDDPTECFNAALATLLFDFLNVYDVCCTQLMQQQGIDLYRALVRSFPVYGRIVSKMCGWNTAYGNETQSFVDVFERLSLPSDYEIPQHTTMNAIQNIAVTKQMIKMLDKKVDIPFLEQCLSGELWLPSGPLYTRWNDWKKKWFYNARKIVFDSNESKLIHAVNEQRIHGYDDLTVNNEELRGFLERHIESRNVVVRFCKATESATGSGLPPSIINSGVLADLEDVLVRPEEDDYTFDEELFDDTAFASFSFYTAPCFPSLKQELIDVGIEPTELLEEDEMVSSGISDLMSDLQLKESTGDEEEEEKYQTRRLIIKTKDFKRHISLLHEHFQFISLNG